MITVYENFVNFEIPNYLYFEFSVFTDFVDTNSVRDFWYPVAKIF